MAEFETKKEYEKWLKSQILQKKVGQKIKQREADEEVARFGTKQSDIEKQKALVENFQRRSQTELRDKLRKGMTGGILRRPKSQRELSRKYNISRYNIKKIAGKDFVQEQLNLAETQRIQSGKIKGVAGKAGRVARKARDYIKTIAWYRTRTRPDGSHRNPWEYEGMNSQRRVEDRFHVGTFSAKKHRLLDLRHKPVTQMPLKSPIQDQTDQPMFGEKKETASRMLDMNNREGNRLLDMKNRGGNRLLDMNNKSGNRFFDSD